MQLQLFCNYSSAIFYCNYLLRVPENTLNKLFSNIPPHDFWTQRPIRYTSKTTFIALHEPSCMGSMWEDGKRGSYFSESFQVFLELYHPNKKLVIHFKGKGMFRNMSWMLESHRIVEHISPVVWELKWCGNKYILVQSLGVLHEWDNMFILFPKGAQAVHQEAVATSLPKTFAKTSTKNPRHHCSEVCFLDSLSWYPIRFPCDLDLFT